MTENAPRGRYIRKLTLSNVRTFRSPVTLDFCNEDGSVAQWTVILGENGLGKTTILQYLGGMLPVQDRSLGHFRREDEPAQPLPFRPMLASERWLNWQLGNLPQPWLRPMQLEAAVELSAPARSLAEASADEHGVPFGFKVVTDEKEGRAAVQITFTGHAEIAFYEQFNIFGYGASRHIAGPSSPYLTSDYAQELQSPVGTLFRDDLPLISPEQWLLSLDHLLARAEGRQAERLKRAYDSARRCLKGSLPDISDFSVKPYGFSEDSLPMTLLCKTPLGHRPVPFWSLSLGYRTMAAWLTDFVKRMHQQFSSLEEPDNGPAIVLIDEFDLHMHPRWQRHAIAALSSEFPNTQFIVTAHSPLVVQAAEGDARVIVLRRRRVGEAAEEIEVVNEPHYAAGWRVDQILESDLYDLPPRSLEYSALMRERIALRKQSRRSEDEEMRLAEIERELNENAPPERDPESASLFDKLAKALDRAEAKQSGK